MSVTATIARRIDVLNNAEHDELVARARALAPAIAAQSEAANRNRDLSPELIAQMHKAGLFRLFQPTRWGGYEIDPRTFLEIQNIFAEVCVSTAWVYGVLTIQSMIVGMFPLQAQQEVWGSNPEALVSSSFFPPLKARPVDGGYRIEGRWSFSSGSSFAQWVQVGVHFPAEDPDGPPQYGLLLLPRSDYEVVDVWNTFGLRATGSNDIVIRDVFVPAHRALPLDSGLINPKRGTQAGSPPASPLYRFPWLYLFSGAVSYFAVGAARGALKAFLDKSRSRIAVVTGKPAKENPAVLAAASRLFADIDTIDAQYSRHIEEMLAKINADEQITVQQGLMYRMQLTSGLRRLAATIDEFMQIGGARSINADSPLTQLWLDLMAARVHPANDPSIASQGLGLTLIDQGF